MFMSGGLRGAFSSLGKAEVKGNKLNVFNQLALVIHSRTTPTFAGL